MNWKKFNGFLVQILIQYLKAFDEAEHYIMDAFEGVMASLEKLSKELMKLNKQREVIKEHKGDKGSNESHFIDLFIGGLKPQMRHVVRRRNPKNLWYVYWVALCEEANNNLQKDESDQPLLSSLRVKESSGIGNGLVPDVLVGIVKESKDENVEDTSEMEKVSNCVMVLDDCCKKTELRVCGLDADMKGETNESIDTKLMVMEVDEFDVVMNSNKVDWTSNFNKPVDTIKECSMEQKENGKENNNLVANVGLEIQIVVAITETLSCSSPTVVGANEHTIYLNEGCIQNGVCLFGICCDLKHVEGLVDEEKGYEDTGCKMAICYDRLWKYEKRKEKLIRNQSGSEGTKDTSDLGILTYDLKAEQAIELICGHVPFLSTILFNGSTEKKKMDKFVIHYFLHLPGIVKKVAGSEPKWQETLEDLLILAQRRLTGHATWMVYSFTKQDHEVTRFDDVPDDDYCSFKVSGAGLCINAAEVLSFGVAYLISTASWYQEPKFLIKMPLRRTTNIYDVYECIMPRMEERLDQFVDQFANRMNDMMNPRRLGDRNGRRNEGGESEIPFFEGGGSSLFAELEGWEGDGVADGNYEEALVFDDDQYEEEIKKNRCQFMIPILKMSLRKKNDLSGKEDLVGKKTASKTL
uniref:Uncharacterized protein n=1 Tax=Tanacetum cinerariifolium TaxID=118510 RepID=A0A6L2MC93_TANCI|nr:hypothetical protein [Tanacetum cinerariifolium]